MRSLHYDESKIDAVWDAHMRERERFALHDRTAVGRSPVPVLDIPPQSFALAVGLAILLWAGIIGGGWIIVECVMHRWFQ